MFLTFQTHSHVSRQITLSHVTNNSTTNIKYHNEILSKYVTDGGDRTDRVDTSDSGDENLNL